MKRVIKHLDKTVVSFDAYLRRRVLIIVYKWVCSQLRIRNRSQNSDSDSTYVLKPGISFRLAGVLILN